MEDFDRHVTITDSLLTCSLCRGEIQEAVQLICLHCCCRRCFTAAAKKDSSHCVGCPICGTITQEGSDRPNGFIDSQVARCRLIAESKVCGLCKSNGQYDKPAIVWCSTCRHSLCGDCITAHRQCYRLHLTQPLEELGSLDEACLPDTAICAIHKKPRDIACVNCEKVVCISCWAECKKNNHEVHIVGDEAFDNYVGKLVSSLSAMESELLLKSKALKQPARNLQDAKMLRDRHLQELKDRKKFIVDAVETVYQQIEVSTKHSFDEIESDGETDVAIAAHIDSSLSDARSYVRCLVESNDKCEIFNQQKIVQDRIIALSAEVDGLSDRLATKMRIVKFGTSVPEDLEDLVRTWIGMSVICAASSSSSPHHLLPQTQVQLQQLQQQQSFSFGDASVSMQLPVECRDVALTKDGSSVLLAVGQHGLLEFSSSCGHELSRWYPTKYKLLNNMEVDDWVVAVSALSDGRAAVSLHYTRLVVLLRRGENISSSSRLAAAAGDAWTEQLCFEPLPWPSDRLSAHGDILAMCQSSYLCPGTELLLLNLSSGRRWSNTVLRREYWIGSLAVAAGIIVTGSKDKVELGGGRRAAHVIDAHRLADGDSDDRLWRNVLSYSDEKDEELRGVCTDSSSESLYAVLCMRDKSSSRVCVLSLRDGSELRRVALSFSHPAAAARPWRLALSDSRTAATESKQKQQGSSSRIMLMVAMHLDEYWRGRRTEVTVHHGSMNNAGQVAQHM